MNKEDQNQTAALRRKIFLTALRGGQAHLASSFSCLEILYALYVRGVLRLEPGKTDDPDRDRLILSKGHAGLAMYACMNAAGVIPEDAMTRYLQPDGDLGGEPVTGTLPGIEAATGSLGHGLSIGVGMAMAGRMDQRDYTVYVILGDGECQEGTIWEAAVSACRYSLGNLTVILDSNRIQKMGFVDDAMGRADWKAKWQAFGWRTEEITDGHDVDEIVQVLTMLKQDPDPRPRLVIANTVKGKGVSLMENSADWHFRMPRRKELKVFLKELGISEDEV